MKVLSVNEVEELSKLMRLEFHFMRGLRTQYPLAKLIKVVQIPSVLSESLAIHLLRGKYILPDFKCD